MSSLEKEKSKKKKKRGETTSHKLNMYNETASYVPDAKVEIELPRRDVLREITFLVCERDADLDELEEIDVATHGLVVIV